MILLIDVGNTHTVFAIHKDDTYLTITRIEKTEEIVYDNKEIDITNIVFSGARGVSMGIEYKCHKDECKDSSYSTKNKVDKYGNVILTIEPIGLNKWQMLHLKRN